MNQPKQSSSPKSMQVISAKQGGERLRSRILEEQIQEAVGRGQRHLQIEAYGSTASAGASGGPQTNRSSSDHRSSRAAGGVHGVSEYRDRGPRPASDDVGWLNAGRDHRARHAGNGAANAMAQGRIYIAGNIGARA